MIIQQTIQIQSSGRDIIDITQDIKTIVSEAKVSTGLCHLFLQHTSASIILCENYDPDVKLDLENFIARLIPDGDPLFKHTLEGPDDMAAHIRTVLTHNDLTIPITDGALQLGTWQGICCWEHRYQGHQRKVIVTVTGE